MQFWKYEGKNNGRLCDIGWALCVVYAEHVQNKNRRWWLGGSGSALSYTGQIADAEDISQTVFLKLMDHYSRLTPGKEKNWLLKVAANESRSMLRQRRHLVQETIPEIPFAEPQDSLLFELVQALEFKYRAVVYLFYYEGYSTQEIGEILGIRRSCVTTRLNRARAMLKREMEETNA